LYPQESVGSKDFWGFWEGKRRGLRRKTQNRVSLVTETARRIRKAKDWNKIQD